MRNIRDLCSKKFKNRARGPDAYDCWGLVIEVMRRYGIDIPDYDISAGACTKIDKLVASEKVTPKWVRLDKPETPCVITLRNSDDMALVNHCGVYLGYGKFIHILADVGVLVERIDSPAWSSRIEGYYKYVG